MVVPLGAAVRVSSPVGGASAAGNVAERTDGRSQDANNRGARRAQRLPLAITKLQVRRAPFLECAQSEPLATSANLCCTRGLPQATCKALDWVDDDLLDKRNDRPPHPLWVVQPNAMAKAAPSDVAKNSFS
jgi:hypothetical protein